LDDINFKLNDLYSYGRRPIDDAWREVENEQQHIQSAENSGSDDQWQIDDLQNQIWDLESQRDSAVSDLEQKLANERGNRDATLSGLDSRISSLENDLAAAGSDSGSSEPVDTSGLEAQVAALEADVAAELAAVEVLIADETSRIDAIEADARVLIDALESEKSSVESDLGAALADTASSSTEPVDPALVESLQTQIAGLDAQIQAEQDAADAAIGVVFAEVDALIAAHQSNVDNFNAQIDSLNQQIADAGGSSSSSGDSASIEAELSNLRSDRDSEANYYSNLISDLENDLNSESGFWDDQIRSLQNQIDDLNSKSEESVDDSYFLSLIEFAEGLERDYESEIRDLEDSRAKLEQLLN